MSFLPTKMNNTIQSNAIPNIILFFNKYEILFLHSFDK